VDETVIFKICGAHSSAIVVHMKLGVSFFKVACLSGF